MMMRYIKRNLQFIKSMAIKHIILFLATMPIAAYSFAQKQDPIILDQVIAVIADEMVKQSDVDNQLQQMVQFGAKEYELNACELFEDMLFQKLLVNQAKIDSIVVADNEIDSEIARRIEAFAGSANSMEKIEKFYGKSELEIKTEWRPLVKEQILAQRIQTKIIGDIEVSPNEIRTYFMQLNPDSLPTIPTQYEYAQISIKPTSTTEEELEVKKKLEEIRQRAIKGENFSKLAVLYSDDMESARVGGLLGDYISRGELVPEFAAVAFKLKEGEISKIVKTSFGYHIIQMIELKGEKAKLKHILMRIKPSYSTMQAAENKADSIYKLLQDTLSFTQAALLYSADERTKHNGGKYINPYTNSSKIEVEMIDPTVVHSIKKLNPMQISEPILAYDETGLQVYKIYQLIAITPEHKATLLGDYNVVKEMALHHKKQKAIEAWVQEKLTTTYISLPPSKYKNCEFKYGNWRK